MKRKAKRDADKARKAEEEKRRQEQEDLLSQQRQVQRVFRGIYIISAQSHTLKR